MRKNKIFWENLKTPIYALAPMAGVTDSAFRQICKDFGADVVYSEMASVTALAYNSEKTLDILKFSKKERPFIVQLFGSNPKHFVRAVKLLTSKKEISKLRIPNYQLPQGIDINFGCPVKKVLKQGAGAVLMDNLKLSREIIKSVIQNTKLPVSIKTRSKAAKVDILKFLDYMRDLDIKAVMIHGRTLAQGFSGEVDWKIIKEARKYFGGIILANGGVEKAEDAWELLQKTGADGVGIGRGALGRPWIFSQLSGRDAPTSSRGVSTEVDKKFIFKIALKHAKQVYKLKDGRGIKEMRKHLCWYVSGLPGASELRQKLVRVESLEEIKRVLLAC